ncbi:pilus assembly protein [Serratia proteamaculans]|uniref:fimbrial protein n=1 Tax=Serratia proteamaculans TaxID=28151 RepID=UPI001076B56F|nr:fimbrial protein [Serratia proteamaculans]TFZ53068.1 pilus assembly protein [Serratia proteamaculans]
MNSNINLTLLLFAGLFFCGRGWAAENLAFRGTLQEAIPCDINRGGVIDINFGERVGVKRVNGVNYLQPVPYTLDCALASEQQNELDLTLTVMGEPTSFNGSAVQTREIADLGIQLIQNGKPFELNKPIKINLNDQPRLEAVPVQRPGALLSEGAFEATATLMAAYQ